MLKPQLFSNKLRLSFIVLTLFTIMQAALTLWVSRQAQYHIERGRVANILLSDFIDLGGNKQRLKVWLAQYLLTDNAPLEEKIDLQNKMERTLVRLKRYLEMDKEISNGSEADVVEVKEQIDRLKTLEINILSLRTELDLISQGETPINDYGEIWKFMIQVFDKLEGRDLKRLINDAIEIQRKRAAKAEYNSAQSILFFKRMVYALTLMTLMTAFVLAYLILKSLKRPLEQLVTATQEMMKGNLSHRINEIDQSEFGLLSNQFNMMADEIEKSRNQEKNERKRIEKEVEDRTHELQMALQELKRAEMERKSFLTSVGHELKTPATVIMGEAEVTLRGGSKETAEYIETIKNIHLTSKQLSMRIEDLLVLAKDENEIFSVMEQELDGERLNQALKTTVNVYKNGKGERIQYDLQLNSQTSFKGDSKRIQQLIVILVDNALKYSPDKTLIAIKTSEDSHYVNIEVVNDAYFIDEIRLDKIFEKYYRDEKALRLRPEGLGVGLYIARLIAEAHSGSIEASVDKNGRFRVLVKFPRGQK